MRHFLLDIYFDEIMYEADALLFRALADNNEINVSQ